MLFNFLGCPQSGKTTTAAMTFSSMKETGIVAEFNPEQARIHIAHKRVLRGLKPEDTLELHDDDHLEIMAKQLEVDETLVKACGPDVMIISDSSPLNSVLYMSPECRAQPEVLDMIRHSASMTTCTFYTHPIYHGWALDPNRIHDEAESLKIDKNIPLLLADIDDILLGVVPVFGSTSERLMIVQNQIFFSKRP